MFEQLIQNQLSETVEERTVNFKPSLQEYRYVADMRKQNYILLIFSII